MARTTEYTRVRRVVMQLVLAGALLLTLGMGWWVSAKHSKALTVKLTPVHRLANEVLTIDLALPMGWTVARMESNSSYAVLMVTEGRVPYGSSRKLRMWIEQLDKPEKPGQAFPTSEEFLTQRATGRTASGQVRTLEFLGAAGVEIEYPAERVPAELTKIYPPALYAAVVLPAKQAAVILELTGPHTLAPADRDVLRKVALSMALPDPGRAAPPALPRPAAPRKGSEPGEMTTEPGGANPGE